MDAPKNIASESGPQLSPEISPELAHAAAEHGAATGHSARDADSSAQAKFRNMKEGTAQDWQHISGHFMDFAKHLPDRVLTHLKLLDGDYGGFPVDRLEHSLQTATRAHRDGRGESYVVMALLHDIGDTLGTYNHPDISAAMLKPFVTEEEHWICQQHGAFQGYYFFHHIGQDRNIRDRFADSPRYDACAEFCEKYDQAAFDPGYDSLPLEFFEPMLRRVMARPVNSMYVKTAEDA